MGGIGEIGLYDTQLPRLVALGLNTNLMDIYAFSAFCFRDKND